MFQKRAECFLWMGALLWTANAQAAPETVKRELDFSGVTKLEVETVHTDVDVHPGNGAQGGATFSEDIAMGGERCKADFRATREGNRILVKVSLPPAIIQICQVQRRLILDVPRSFSESLRVKLGHGRFQAGGFTLKSADLEFVHGEASTDKLNLGDTRIDARHSDFAARDATWGALTLVARHGKFDFQRLKAGKTDIDGEHSEVHWTGEAATLGLNLRHTDGKFSLRETESLTVKAQHSDIELALASPRVSYNTEHGELTLALPGVRAPNVNGKSSHTSVRVRLDKEAAFSYEMVGSHTDMSSSFPVLREKEDVLLRGEYGAGGKGAQGEITLDGSHGKIALEKM